MSDLMAKCDWYDGTLSVVLSEDPERIAVRLFDSRLAPARLYVPEVETLALRAENAKLRELVRIAIEYCDSGTCDGCPIQRESGSCPYSDMARELGVEVD